MKINKELEREVSAYFGLSKETRPTQTVASEVPVILSKAPAPKGVPAGDDPELVRELAAFFGIKGGVRPSGRRVEEAHRAELSKRVAEQYGGKPEDLGPPSLLGKAAFEFTPLTEGQKHTAVATAKANQVKGDTSRAKGATTPKQTIPSFPAGDAPLFFARALAAGKREVGYITIPNDAGELIQVPACSAF